MNNKPHIRIDSICIVHDIDPIIDEMNIWVEGEISYRIPQFYPESQTYIEHKRRSTLQSQGVWGIGTHTEFDIQVEFEKDELSDLKAHMEIMGVDVSNFEQIKYQLRSQDSINSDRVCNLEDRML